ncbi:MAG: hypothetical protein ACE5HO_05120 [bacterium]
MSLLTEFEDAEGDGNYKHATPHGVEFAFVNIFFAEERENRVAVICL